MAFQARRFHDSMQFADSTAQYMAFWRQRIALETQRQCNPPGYPALQESPQSPFQLSSTRETPLALGRLAPDLAAYRAHVPPSTMTPRPQTVGLLVQRPFWQIPSNAVPAWGDSNEATAKQRAARGMLALERPARVQPPLAFEKHLQLQMPNQLIGASLRFPMARARLDARMYSPSPG